MGSNHDVYANLLQTIGKHLISSQVVTLQTELFQCFPPLLQRQGLGRCRCRRPVLDDSRSGKWPRKSHDHAYFFVGLRGRRVDPRLSVDLPRAKQLPLVRFLTHQAERLGAIWQQAWYRQRLDIQFVANA
ncbi:hypothetical protein D9M71_671630 [compost metagenome]